MNIRCLNLITFQPTVGSLWWRNVQSHSAVLLIKIVGWGYFSVSTALKFFEDVPAVFVASGRMRGKVGRRLLYLHFLLQVRHLLASHRNNKYQNASTNIQILPKNIQMQPQMAKKPPNISKCHQKYSNGTKNN